MRGFWRKTICSLMLCQVLAAAVFALPDRLVPLGRAVGIQLDTEGVLVVGFSEQTSPARQAGLQPGDRICCVDGAELADAKTLQQLVKNCGGKALTLTVRGEAHSGDYVVLPAASAGGYSLGITVRNGTSGIGTITYYDPKSGRYGALGHGIMDQSGKLFPLEGGTLLDASIAQVRPSSPQSPGALQGLAASADPIGTVDENCPSGIYGDLTLPELPEAALPLAQPEEIRPGPAKILTTIQGSSVCGFQVEILKYAPSSEGKELLLHVIDEDLITKTGGIVQGMSGSPILQNGRLVGAVTHVLVGEPTYGYGITIASMLEGDREQLEEIP